MVKQNRWLRMAAGVLMMLVLSTLYSWSIFRHPLSELYPQWTISDLSLPFTLGVAFLCFGCIFSGKLTTRTSNAVGAAAGAVMIFAAYFGVSLLPEDAGTAKWLLYVLYGGLGGFGTGVSYNAVLSGVSAWFPDRPGQATGILLTAFGIGSMLMGQLADSLFPVFGVLGAFRVLAVLIAAVVLLGSPFTRMPGADAHLPAAAAKAAGGKHDYTTRQMMGRLEFWMFFLWNVCMSAASLMVVGSAAGIASYYGAAAVLGLLVSVFNGVSRIPLGMCLDALGWKKTFWMANGFLMLAAVFLIGGGLTGFVWLVMPGMLLMGICFGNSITVAALVVRMFYGSKHYAENFPIINACAIFGAILGPSVSSWLQEAAGGDYLTTFITLGILGLLSCGLSCLVKEPD